MGFASLDDLISEMTAGKYLRREMAKSLTPAAVAGNWTLFAGYNGYPIATTFPNATDLLWTPCTDIVGEGTNIFGIQHGGNVSPDTKHIANVGAMIVAAAGAPWQAKLVDIQAYYRLSGANVTGTSGRTCINSNAFTVSSSSGLLLTTTNDFGYYGKCRVSNSGGALPTGLSIDTDYWLVRVSSTTFRIATSYANALAGTVIAYTDTGSGTHTVRMVTNRATNGAGCMAFFVTQTAPTLGGPNLTASAYDDPTLYTGAGANAFPGSPSMMATPVAGAVPHSGAAAAGRYGPFLPLAAGNLGIARVNSFTLSTGTAFTGTGVLALVIAKPILDIAIPVTGMWSERDFVNQLPSLPKIEDGACLAWMVFSTGATTNNSPFTATIDFVWG